MGQGNEIHGPAGTLVPTWRERGSRAVGGLRLAVWSMKQKVGLTVLGRPGSAFGHGVRHIIAARNEARGIHS